MIAAVVFDLDGILIDSEHVWDEVRQELAEERGGHWSDTASRDMMGMSSPEWAHYMRDVIGIADEPHAISTEVVRRLEARYARELPLIEGSGRALERLSAHWQLALASSSNRELIDLVLDASGFARFFAATVSSEEVPRGKPAPDVYLEAAARLSADPARCAAIEDSHNGILAARAAGMRTIAIPNPRYPPGLEALLAADVVLDSIHEVVPDVVDPEAASSPTGGSGSPAAGR